MYIYLKKGSQNYAELFGGETVKMVSVNPNDYPHIVAAMEDMKTMGSSSAHVHQVEQGIILHLNDADADNYADVALCVHDASTDLLNEIAILRAALEA